MEERFRNYKNDLFSLNSKELDRELLGQEENKRISASVASYLKLLSGFLELHSALKTLEYLIRRYKYAISFHAIVVLFGRNVLSFDCSLGKLGSLLLFLFL